MNKPKYRMPYNPYTNRRMRMTEDQMIALASNYDTGGTVSMQYAFRVTTAIRWLTLHGIDWKEVERTQRIVVVGDDHAH